MFKIAIIGSGIAGLTAAYRLSRDQNMKVTLFERQPRPGIDAHRVQIHDGDRSVTVDVPSRMFNSEQWPRLSNLYQEIGVESVPVEPSQSFSLLSPSKQSSSKQSSSLLTSSMLGSFNLDSLKQELSQVPSLQTYLRHDIATRTTFPIREMFSSINREIAAETVRFFRVGTSDLGNATFRESAAETLIDYLRRLKFSDTFVYRFLYPTLSSTVCTCSYESLDRYPARIVLQTLANLVQPTNLMRTRWGTSDVAERLSASEIDSNNSTDVEEITEVSDGVRLDIRDGQSLLFDHVVIATQASKAMAMVAEPHEQEHRVLRAIRYDQVPVSVHRDTALMPKRRSKWSTFNMATEPSFTSASCTVWLNRFYGNWVSSQPVFQTIGSSCPIDESKIERRATLYRSVVDAESVAALDQLDQLHRQEERRIWFCGSWASRGLPLLESAVVSAEHVAARVVEVANQLDTVRHRR